MATTTANPPIAGTTSPGGTGVSAWPRGAPPGVPSPTDSSSGQPAQSPSQSHALQALLAFSALHEQLRRRKALAVRRNGFDQSSSLVEFEPSELFVLDEVLQLVAERAVAITGADGLAIALAEHDEIVLRAAAGAVRPDVGARIDRDSAFSGACFKTAQIINCDDTEVDPRVNLEACRKLGARSMIAVPLCGRRRVIGVLEAFSSWPFGFNDSDIGSLTLLAELIVGALKPEDEDRFAESAAIAASKLEVKPLSIERPASFEKLPGTTEPGPAEAKPAPTAEAKPAAATTNFVSATETKSIPALPPAKKEIPPLSPTQPAKDMSPQAVPAEPIVPQSAVPQSAVPALTAPAKPLQAEPVNVEIVPTPSTEILDVPPAEIGKTSDLETALAASTVPELTFGQSQPEDAKHLPRAVIVLVCIVIVFAFAGGVWWKLKTAQLGSAMVQTPPAQTQQAAAQPTQAEKDLTAPPVPAAPNANPALAAQPGSDATSDADEAQDSPASAQEISKFPRVTGIRHWSAADSSTVVLDLEDQVQYEEHQITNPTRFYYDLRDTQLSPDLSGKSIEVGDGFLTRIRIAQPVAGMTRLVLETKAGANIAHPEVSLELNPYRLVIEVHKQGATPKGAVNLFPNEGDKRKLAIVIPPPTKEDLQLRARVPRMRIVVDAGHGGWDLGTVGRSGLLEKDLVLEIAQRLGKLLQSRLGADVILTRNDDSYIPLDERAEIANQAQADLFISVHANYSDLPSARGVETYYTNFFSAPGLKEDDSKDAAVDNASTKRQVTPTLSAADLHERIEQSRRLAASVQRSLYGTLSVQNPGLRDRGVKEAGFVVLTESAMPGILAEVSFVSSPTDEQKLRSNGYREEIAEALYRGIARYAAGSKNVKLASAAK
jgi:N-acetylmuramoyl-L-alanine amidase/putative methionine-R-sulfoxide reductase with GAF domain